MAQKDAQWYFYPIGQRDRETQEATENQWVAHSPVNKEQKIQLPVYGPYRINLSPLFYLNRLVSHSFPRGWLLLTMMMVQAIKYPCKAQHKNQNSTNKKTQRTRSVIKFFVSRLFPFRFQILLQVLSCLPPTWLPRVGGGNFLRLNCYQNFLWRSRP